MAELPMAGRVERPGPPPEGARDGRKGGGGKRDKDMYSMDV